VRLPDYAERQLGNALCIACLTAANGSAQTLLTPLLSAQGKAPATIGTLVAVAAVVALIMRIPGGLLYSPRRARPLMCAALAAAAVATFIHPLSDNVWLFAGIRVLYGVGYSVGTTVNMALFVDSIAHEGDRRRASGLYASAMASGYTVGGVAGGFTGQLLGFRLAYAVIAGLWLLAMLPVLLRAVPAGPSVAAPPRPAGFRRAQALGSLVRDPLIVSMVLAGLFINLQQALFVTFTPLVLLAIGLGISQLGIMRSVFSLTNAITRPVAGAVLGRVDHHRAQDWGIAMNACVLSLFYLPLGFVPYLGVAVVAGFGRAVAVVANTVALTQDVDPRRVSRGVASGILNAALDLGNIIGPILGGVIATAVGIHYLWLIAPPLYLVSYMVLQALLRRRKPAATPLPST
jgi:DHA1 family multidrug resistance protein-like MFS transporter